MVYILVKPREVTMKEVLWFGHFIKIFTRAVTYGERTRGEDISQKSEYRSSAIYKTSV